MAATTISAMYTNLRKLIKGLEPDGAALGGEAKYKRAAEKHSWDEPPRSASDWDRRFTVHDLARGTPLNFGSPDEYDYDGTFRVSIGHVITDKESEGQTRRDTDAFQIAEELEKSSNFPSGVSLIRYMDKTILKYSPEHWLTTLVFEIHFSAAAP